MQNEEKSQGEDPEMQELCKEILTKVVPRLLRPLETGGRQIQPCLVHRDIWDGNVSTDKATNTPVIFDATCIYAHNESTYTAIEFSCSSLTKNLSRARASATDQTQNGKGLCGSISQSL